MLLLPKEFLRLDGPVCAVVFPADLADSFSTVGAILAPGETNSECNFARDGFLSSHIFNLLQSARRAVWSSHKACHILLRHLIAVFAPTGVLVMRLDDTIERRGARQIAAKGIYRDPVVPAIATWSKPAILR